MTPLLHPDAELWFRIEDRLQRLTSPWLNRADAAAFAGCSASQIDNLVNQGKLTSYTGTGKPVVSREELENLIKSKRKTAQP